MINDLESRHRRLLEDWEGEDWTELPKEELQRMIRGLLDFQGHLVQAVQKNNPMGIKPETVVEEESRCDQNYRAEAGDWNCVLKKGHEGHHFDYFEGPPVIYWEDSDVCGAVYKDDGAVCVEEVGHDGPHCDEDGEDWASDD